MSHPLGKLIVIMFQFVVGGFHMGLVLRQVSTSLTIGLFLAFSCQIMGRFHGPCEYFLCEIPMISFPFYAFRTVRCPFSFKFHL
jgi:hypothetical protein